MVMGVSSSPLNIHLEHYDGPLDLLLDLIRKQEVNIYDIPIARITAQYLKYMERAVELDMELGAEFVYMAATLIHIKSRLLLPRDPVLDQMSPDEDPRRELVERLLEHERFKNAAEMLQQKRLVEEAVWSNPQISQFLADEDGPGLAVTLFDLVKTFEDILERAKHRPLYEVSKDDVSVPEMMRYLKRELAQRPKGELLSLRSLFERLRSRRAMLCLFLAILEMVRRQGVILAQKEAFGEIMIRRHKRFEEALADDDAITNIAEEYR